VLKSSRQELIEDLQRRVNDRILEPTNYELLKKLIKNADTLDEAIMLYKYFCLEKELKRQNRKR